MSDIHAVDLWTAWSHAPIVEERIAGCGLAPVTEHAADADSCRISVYCQTRAEAESEAAQVKACLEAAPAIIDHVDLKGIRPVANEDWAESWKQHFHSHQPSSRILIKPTWERIPDDAAPCVIELDPGMSFGTGQHETTQTCLALMDRHGDRFPQGSCLDIGCGSGILTIAAIKLGFATADAFDYDEVAVAAAKENVVLNQVADRTQIWQVDLEQYVPEQQYDLVIANLLANILNDHLATILKTVRPGGMLIISGTLTQQYADLKEKLTAEGLQEQESETQGEWQTGAFGWATTP